MNFEDLATKQDIIAIKEEIKALLSSTASNSSEQKGITSNEIKALWGIPSVSLINNLRMKGELAANKAGKIWIYNRAQVMSFIPQIKDKRK